MAWIKVIEEQDAMGELAKYYEAAREDGRRLSNIGIVSSLNVDAMKAIDAFQHPWRENGALNARHREMIALVTSALNRCHY